MAGDEVRMMMSVYPGAMTGFAALQSGLVSINNVFMSMTRAMDAQFGLIDTAIITTGAVVTQLGIDAMNAFGQFEQSMKIVQMVSGQTKSDIEQLGQTANQFSVQYRMDIDQITEGLQTLGRAGLNSASEQSEVLQNGLNTAKLEGRELNSVLEELIQNTALLGGDLKSSEFGEQSQYVNDLLVATSMTAPITTHDVSETLKYSGGIAAAAGANIETEEGKAILEDYMASIAAFAQKGVTGSIAGTALRAFFNKPATQDSSVVDALASIKLKPEYLWEDDEQTMKPVSEQIGIIKGQMDKLGVSTMDRLQIWSKIVGGKMGQQMMKLDSDDIKELKKDIQAADDSTSLATRSMQTYQANVKQLGESGALLQRNVGAWLVKIVNPFLEFAGKVVGFLNQDFLSFPLAAGIIAFIGMAGKKAMGVISSIKAEISSLLSGMQTFYTQKQGWVAPYKPPFDKDYKGGGKGSGKKSEKTKETAKEVGKQTAEQFAKAYGKTSVPTVAELRKEGLTDTEIAMRGRFAKLSKDSTGLGISDARFAEIMSRGVLPEHELDAFKGRIVGTNAARDPFDATFLRNGKLDSRLIPYIQKDAQAMKELGPALQKMGYITTTNVVGAKQYTEAMQNTFGSTRNAGNALNYMSNSAKNFTTYQNAMQNTFGSLRNVSGTYQNVIKGEVAATESAIAATEALTAALNSYVPASQRFMQEINAMKTNQNIVNPIPVNNKNYPNSTTDTSPTWGSYPGNHHHSNPNVLGTSPIYSNYSADAAHRDYLLEKGKNSKYAEPTAEEIKAEKERVQKIRESTTPYYAKGGDPQAEYWNRKGDPYLTEDRRRNLSNDGRTIVGKHGGSGIVLSKEEQEAKAKRLGLGKHAEDTLLEKARKKAAKNLEDGTSPMSKTGGAFISMKGAANRMEKELDAITKTLEDKRNLNDRIMARQASITRGSMPRDPAGMGRFGLGRSDIQRIQEEGSVSNKRRPYTSRGSLSEKSSGAIIGRSDVRRIAKESRDVAANSVRKLTSDSIKNSMETNNLQKKLNNEVNKLVSSNKQLGSTYLNGIQKANQSISSAVAAHNQANFSKKFYQDLKQQTVPDGMTRYYQQNGVSIIGGKYTMLDGIAGPYTPVDTYKPSSQGFGSAFYANFTDKLNRNRADSFLSFGNKMVDGVLTSSTKGLTGFGNKLLNATDAVGGPFMVAIMAASFAIQAWQKAFQDYCEDLKEAGDKLKEAYSEWNTAENDLRESFKDKNPDATDEEIDQMIYDSYATMNEDMANAINNGTEEWLKKTSKAAEEQKKYEYDTEKDDGTMKEAEEPEVDETVKLEDAIKEKTGALYQETGELNSAMNKYVNKGTDSWWGVDGWTGDISDAFGERVDSAGFGEIFQDKAGIFGNDSGSKFTDDSQFLLTARQADENYAGYTEMAGLMLEDFKDAEGDWRKGLKTMMGTDADVLSEVISDKGKQTLQNIAGIDENGKRISGSLSTMSPQNNLRLQQSMKNDQKTWKNLAKEIAKRDINKKAGRDTNKNLTRIQGLINKLNASMNNRFTETQIMQAAYLQQMQDMYKVANDVIVPIINTNMETAAQTLYKTHQIGDTSEGIDSSSAGTEGITSIIAGMVAQIAMAQAADATYNAILMQDPSKLTTAGEKEAYKLAQESSSGAEFMKKAASASYTGEYTSVNWGELWGQATKPGKDGPDFSKAIYSLDGKNATKAMDDILTTFGAGLRMTTYGEDQKTAWDKVSKAIDDWRKGGSNTDQIYKSLSNITQDPQFLNQLENAYLASGEDEESGSGSGSGSGNDDKDKGTKKERVDLVLCNKKEIPKLNVNLFKKPPTFTVLNKNFKVRDVKINTEDTPKAIMASIKNAFIDVQKRSDPKIIQDEEAEYDPVAATDGNAVPSGSSRSGTS